MKNERFQMNRIITSAASCFLSSFVLLPPCSQPPSYSPSFALSTEELLMYSAARLVAPLLMEFPIFFFPSTRLCSSFPSPPPSLSPLKLVSTSWSVLGVDRLPNSLFHLPSLLFLRPLLTPTRCVNCH